MTIRLVSPNFSDLLTPNIEIKKFPDGDCYIRVPQIDECRNREVVLYHRLYPNQNDNLVELLFILDALKQVDANVTVVAPYLPYARQDKVVREGEVKSASIICGLLANAGCEKLVAFDVHFLNSEGEHEIEGLKLVNLSMGEALIKEAEKLFGGEPYELVAPDKGASYLFAGRAGKWMEKLRGDYAEGGHAYRHVKHMKMDVEKIAENVLIVDDIIETGGTILRCVAELKALGAKNIVCATVHGQFLNDSLSSIQSHCKTILATDTIVSTVSKVSIKNKINF